MANSGKFRQIPTTDPIDSQRGDELRHINRTSEREYSRDSGAAEQKNTQQHGRHPKLYRNIRAAICGQTAAKLLKDTKDTGYRITARELLELLLLNGAVECCC